MWADMIQDFKGLLIYPWWKEKEIVSEERREKWLCPLTLKETASVLKAQGFNKIGEIYGCEHTLSVLKEAFPNCQSTSTSPGFPTEWSIASLIICAIELQQFQNHSSQMTGLYFIVFVASNTFIPIYDGNMAKIIEFEGILGLGKQSCLTARDSCCYWTYITTSTRDQFAIAVKEARERRTGAPTRRRVISHQTMEEEYFYANPRECLCEGTNCHSKFGHRNSTRISLPMKEDEMQNTWNMNC
ncbi:hypothetical protein HID58_096253 [Brassica napus]|uniref:Post-SET domain-containing protein n=1 Tax=Brassica napus TaxID=3708 RepID=A0ABQ7X3A8_BRANA|nr:hypothetical protein HID58_096253 [Brassica napus]